VDITDNVSKIKKTKTRILISFYQKKESIDSNNAANDCNGRFRSVQTNWKQKVPNTIILTL